ncbi:hypothetical protein [Agrobacterium vitis]|nr:hypothetical protein [Agrobacterium vitis]
MPEEVLARFSEKSAKRSDMTGILMQNWRETEFRANLPLVKTELP